MNDTGEKDDNQPADAESVPTSSSGPGMVGIGEQIGRYKLLRILGEGGFGIVYLAEQQRPMKRQVALKIIKPGMDSAQVIKRFEAERQALAMLDHPNIAQVFDAGTTKFGRPYFVMEYFKGVPIAEHCETARGPPSRSVSTCLLRSVRPSSTPTRKASSIAKPLKLNGA